MATYLTVEDLAGFLRSRKSKDCKVAADWAQDHPDSLDTQWCVDKLEGFAIATGSRLLNIAQSSPTAWRLWHRAGLVESRNPNSSAGLAETHNHNNRACWPALAALAPRYLHPMPFAGDPMAWALLVNECSDDAVRCGPARSVVLVRRLKEAMSRRPLAAPPDTEGEYAVEFLICRRVLVGHALDEIQAELNVGSPGTELEFAL